MTTGSMPRARDKGKDGTIAGMILYIVQICIASWYAGAVCFTALLSFNLISPSTA